MQVQKLVYFAHAVFLAVNEGKPLIRESFYAYPFGPVEKLLYEQLRRHRAYPVDLIEGVREEELTRDEEEAIEATYQALADKTAADLSGLSHISGGPWEKTWNNGGRFQVIDPMLMREFFA